MRANQWLLRVGDKAGEKSLKSLKGKLLQMMDKFITLIVVIASWCRHVKMYQISQLLTKLVTVIVCQLCS